MLATLIDNALMHGGGTVTIQTSQSARSVVIEVRDEGKGVPPDLVSRIFERSVEQGSPRAPGWAWRWPGPWRPPTAAGSPLAGLRTAAAAREAAGLRRYLVPRAAGKAALDLASNDYLGLSGDARLAEAAAVAARVWGTGATGSRLVTRARRCTPSSKRSWPGSPARRRRSCSPPATWPTSPS